MGSTSGWLRSSRWGLAATFCLLANGIEGCTSASGPSEPTYPVSISAIEMMQAAAPPTATTSSGVLTLSGTTAANVPCQAFQGVASGTASLLVVAILIAEKPIICTQNPTAFQYVATTMGLPPGTYRVHVRLRHVFSDGREYDEDFELPGVIVP